MNILLSRTDNIGDVIFTLPMAGLIKKNYPDSKIYFLGKNYTKDVVERCRFVDQFLNWDELQKKTNPENDFIELNLDIFIHVFPNKKIAKIAKKAHIPMRIGTNRRLYHFYTCNKLVNLTRKNSGLHEALLNIKLLKPFRIKPMSSLELIPELYGMSSVTGINQDDIDTQQNDIISNKFKLILHPKSKGSAREWSAEHYVELCQLLPKETFEIFITGTKEEEQEIQETIISKCPHVQNMVGRFNLSEFILFITQCDGLIACSTGPLHIAAALGKKTIGLYPPIKNMTPNRWGAIGKFSQNLVGKRENQTNCSIIQCNTEKKCVCINNISAHIIFNLISKWKK